MYYFYYYYFLTDDGSRKINIDKNMAFSVWTKYSDYSRLLETHKKKQINNAFNETYKKLHLFFD